MRNINLPLSGGAVITGNYRYLLWREWDNSNKTVCFVMLNPSRADASFNDPTITRCINFAKFWGAQAFSLPVVRGADAPPVSQSETMERSFRRRRSARMRCAD